MYSPRNPYVSLAELRDELKMTADDAANSDRADELLRDIERASRWVDEYTQRTYFFRDHTSAALELDQFDKGVYDDLIITRLQPIIALEEIKIGDDTLEAGVDYIVKVEGEDQHSIRRIGGNWNPSRPGRVIAIKGRFGYLQNSSYPGTVAGDTASQTSGWTLFGTVPAVVYWKLEAQTAGVIRVRLYAESTFATLLAEGQSTTSPISLDQVAGSGLSGRVAVAYTADDTDAANTVTKGAGVYDPTTVPLNLPGRVTISTLKVAAVLSNRNAKEITDLTGAKTTIIESDVPKIVYQLLGKRQPVLI